jgi:hypothetical protein
MTSPPRPATLRATARGAGRAAILSEDLQDGRRLSGVEFLNPLGGDVDWLTTLFGS